MFDILFFIFIDEIFGLCFVTCPQLGFHFVCISIITGHNWLASKLKESGINFKMLDNAFIEIQDWEKANEIAKSFKVEELHQTFKYVFASTYCPVYKEFNELYQLEYISMRIFNGYSFSKTKKIYNQFIIKIIETVFTYRQS